MVRKLDNTLYVTTQGAYVRKRNDTLVVEHNHEKLIQVPAHHLGALVVFGRVNVSNPAIAWCGREGIHVAFMTRYGRFSYRIVGEVTGNVLLRRDQFKAQQKPDKTLNLARSFVYGKLRNSWLNLLRSARDADEQEVAEELRSVVRLLKGQAQKTRRVKTLDELRGLEGDAARRYFSVFNRMIRVEDRRMTFTGRSKRPPTDRVNALLSFLYGMVRNDCVAALEGVGLDPQIGFLHSLRPGRPAGALDLMEEFRPVLADRVAMTLINRRQIQSDDFKERKGGSYQLTDNAIRTILDAYQKRKQAVITHPLLEQKMEYGLIPHIQARLLARTIRDDIEEYQAFKVA